MVASNEMKLKIALLKLQRDNLIRRWERQKRRTAYIKKHLKRITALSMEGWPKTSKMKDYPKWLDIVIDCKIKGIYAIGTSNCDVIAQLSRFAKDFSNNKNSQL